MKPAGHNVDMNRMMHVCPYLGLPIDPASHYAEATEVHKCYSPAQSGAIPLDHQEAFCLSKQYRACSLFVALPQFESDSESAAPLPLKSKPKTLPSRFGLFLRIASMALAVVLTLVVIYLAVKALTPKDTPSALVAPTLEPTRTSTATVTPTLEPAATPNPSVEPTPPSPLANPTPPGDGTVLSLVPESDGVGWAASKEIVPHGGDRFLHAGIFQGEIYISILQFTFGNSLPPGSKILYAAVELTGRNASHLGKDAKWELDLLDNNHAQDWLQTSPSDLLTMPTVTAVGQSLSASELRADGVNRFVFSDAQLKILEQQLDTDQVTFRIKGPTSGTDNLFSWDSGATSIGGLGAPTLYIVAVPGPLTVITNTPTPANVLTAAANAVRATALALQFGTPTPFPPGVVTATPGGGRIEVTPVNTPANPATAEALSAYATAVAITTGTFTPTPQNFVVVYPTSTPVFISINQLLIPPTPTPIVGIDYAAVPIPPFLNGKILAESNRFGDKFAGLPIVMGADGSVAGILSSDLYYQAAYARESFSPDRQRRAIVAASQDHPDVLQIWITNLKTGDNFQVTHLTRGLAYDPAWSPDGNSIVYVSSETGHTEIYLYNIANQVIKQLTVTSEPLVYNQRPSWSPDSKQIVFKSNRGSGTFQIWLMNADGSNFRNLSRNSYDEEDPIWVKP